MGSDWAVISGSVSLEDDQVASFFVSYSGAMISVRDARTVLGLFEYSAADVVDYVAQLGGGDKSISHSSFQQNILKLVGERYIKLNVLQRSMVDFILDRLVITLDPHSRGHCSLDALCTSLLLFCDDDDDEEGKARPNRSMIIWSLSQGSPGKSNWSVLMEAAATLHRACYSLNPALPPADYLRVAELDAKAFCMQFCIINEQSPQSVTLPTSAASCCSCSSRDWR